MKYYVHSVEQDLAGKWYARVCLSPDEAAFLKFDDFPTMAAIQEAAADYVAARQEVSNATAE